MNKKKVTRAASVIYDKENFQSQKNSFLRLRDNVLFYALDGNKQVFQIASSVSFEAKTTVAINLAVALTESGKKVLLVDLDLKKPKVHRTFKVENKNGIIDFMLNKIDYDTMIKKTEYENLHFINRGSEVSDSQVLFQSNRFSELIAKWRNEYDFIIFDSSPILLTSEYINIAKLSDGIIFAIAYAKTKKQQVNESLHLLRNINAPICGAVYTFYDHKLSDEYDGYYGYYSYNSYEGNK